MVIYNFEDLEQSEGTGLRSLDKTEVSKEAKERKAGKRKKRKDSLLGDSAPGRDLAIR